MNGFVYTVHIEEAEEGGFFVTVPALPGCVTQGDTYEEAVAMAQEVIEGFLEALSKAGEPIPKESITTPVDTIIHVKSPASV
jgi:antitoxin HicB